MPEAAPTTKNPILNAIPAYHLIALATLVLLLIAVGSCLPQKKLLRSEVIILPEHFLEDRYLVEVRPGDSFSLIADRLNISKREGLQIVQSGEDAKRLLRLHPGQSIELTFDKYQRVIGLKYQPSLTETLHIDRDLNGFIAHLIVRELSVELNFASGVIEQSLFLSANQAGLNDNLIMELADILGWDIDFALDIRRGDSFAVMFEEKFLDGRKVRNGNILIAEFINQGRKITAIRYEGSEGQIDYFTPEGLSMRKTFRRNPLDVVRISSQFNLNRRHPILHKIRAHRGVDYAASTGTPVRATGDGRVITARVKGGYGNTVEIQHGQRYTTLYAHLSRFGRDIREGRYVRQGQIIGYVGSTGLATGPHLHYEFKVNGVHRNPLTIALPHAKPIEVDERERFELHAKGILEQFETFEQEHASEHSLI